ncbi:hypothetical protein A5748_28365 [Nocardia sp. 852002-51244_SCH5132740]|nr:hypothetical protein A5748_28365 [Nocardia sp. 852002-51244_SCH5132740]
MDNEHDHTTGETAPVDPSSVPRVGSFRFWFATRRWEWSEEVYRMHGYTPGSVVPTTELLLSHKHPDDRDDVAARIARAVDLGESFSSRHRFIDTAGQVHHVMVVADRLTTMPELSSVPAASTSTSPRPWPRASAKPCRRPCPT